MSKIMEELDMNAFSSGLELNYDDFKDFDDAEDIDESLDPKDEDDKDINPTIESTSSEEVDSDNLNEGNEADDEGNTSSNFFNTLTGFIHEKGLLPSLDLGELKVENEEDFVEILKQEIQKQSEYYSNEYLQNLDLEKIARSNQSIKSLDLISEETLKADLNQAKTLIYTDYINQGLSQDRVNKLLERLTDLGEDAIIEEALTSTESLKKFEAVQIESEKQAFKQRQEEDNKIAEQRQELIRKTVFDKNDLFKNYKAPAAVKKEVFETMNTIVSKDPETGEFENKFMKDRRENPVDFDTRMYYVYTLTKGFTDFSNLTQRGKSTAVQDLETAFKNTSFDSPGTPAWSADQNSYDSGLGDELNI